MRQKQRARLALSLAALASTAWALSSILEGCATGQIITEPDGSSGDATTSSDAGCQSGQTSCNGTCTNTASDPLHCGSCTTACADGSVCSQGACATSCSGGTTQCGSSCVNEKTDPQHCGSCDASCAGNDFCDGGVCIPSCTSQQKLCSDGGLFCANIQTDNNNCGDCNIVCQNTWTCQQGKCLPTCGTSETLCDIDGSADGGPPFCTNTNTDNSNCGTCDHPCSGNQYCDAGVCATNPIPTACKVVNGLTWCYHPGVCGEACNTVCSYVGKTPLADAGAWLNAQSTTQNCQNIATAFNNGTSPSITSYTYACVEFQGGVGNDAGTITGQILCSNYSGCPANHLTNMDGLGVACSGSSWLSLCPCQ